MLSIIVPVYNVEKYIKPCLDSIVNQTYKNLEIILIDDGSTDSSGAICDKYARNDSRIKIIHRENAGLVNARKEGLKRASGEFVIYVDADDWVDVNACECMNSFIRESQADIVFYNHYENTGDSQKLVKHTVEEGIYSKNELICDIYPCMIAGNHFFEWQVFPSVWGFIIKRDLLVKSQFEVDDDISMGEDAACTYPCLLMASRVGFVDEAYYHYRQTTNSMIKKVLDIDTERRKISTLYNNVNNRLAKLVDTYDVREQWLDYVLSLIVPRADHLLKGYEDMPFLFPYVDVKRGMKVAIYGAGTYGQRLYNYLKNSEFCDVVAWFDQNHEQLVLEGLDVVNPEYITQFDYDGIIIANMFYNSRKQIADYIASKTETDIFDIDINTIHSEEYLRQFGLM